MISYNIKYFRRYISSTILSRGRQYYQARKVSNFEYTEDGTVSATVKGTASYKVRLHINEDGNISDQRCTCPFDWGGECKHIAAVLMVLENEYNKRILSRKSSGVVSRLISSYTENAIEENTEISAENLAHIVPHIETGGTLKYSLYIGRDKLYVVKDIRKLYDMFSKEEFFSYGKYFEFCHKYSHIDDRSNRLFEITVMNYSTADYYTRSERRFSLNGKWIDQFFELYRDDYVDIDGKDCFVSYKDPVIRFVVNKSDNGRFFVTCDNLYTLLGKGKHGLFMDKELNKIFVASPKFTAAVYDLYYECLSFNGIFISEEDMPAFYTAVIKRAEKYAKVEGLSCFEEFIPPELTPQLYIDCDNNTKVVGRLYYCYGDKIFPAKKAKDTPKNPFADAVAERIVYEKVLKYFMEDPISTTHPLFIDSDDNIADLLSDGLADLTQSMEVYTSERFNRMANRPPVKASIGVKPQEGSLLVNISDDNYSQEEILEILSAYRRGAKYHRLKNGSFAIINESVAELDELTKNLDISDRELLKQNINIPKYRMLYLDSLKRNENVRLQRSEDFKKSVRKYRSDLEGTQITAVPASLEDVMRDYQRYGFRWLKTLSLYGFGGILADDMGLGKTIQSIALMLDAKENADEHRLNLVVCPATLTLNWESEIKKFAPQLNVTTIIGTAAQRTKLIEQAKDSDVLITSYSSLTRDIAKYEEFSFYIHFIDEAQYIKNHSTQNAKAVKAIRSQIRFALTGTPVENSLAEFWSIFDFIMPDYLFNYNHFKKTFEVPIVHNKDENAVKALQKSISPFVLRRLKKDVLPELPEKTETVLLSRMDKEQRKIYAANAAKLKQTLGNTSGEQTEKMKILAQLMTLRQICCDPHLVYENYTGTSAKIEQCVELIDNCVKSGHKVLLFSFFKSVFPTIQERISKLGISYYELTGDTKMSDRIRLQNEFNENKIQVFMISLKAGGNGLNLTGADIVIHFDPWWNKSVENQASDRAYRFGQKNNVTIYKLVAENSIEQNIIKLQEAKNDLNEIVVNGEGDILKMSTDEILSLI
ncbi:MAG: SNF2-related protein [Oscillospiraceae bacterium]